MQVTLDPASSVEEEGQSQNECLPEVDLSSTHCEKSRLLTNELKCLDHRSLVQMMDAERSSCGLVDEERGSELCSSVQSLSIHTLHRGRLADGLGCCRLKNEQDSRHKLCKDTISASSSSHDVSQIQTDKRRTSTSKIQGQCHRTLHCSSGHLQTDITYFHDDSKFRKISHNKKPPVSMHIHKNRTSFTFANFIFTSIFLVSLFSPSLSLTTSSASTSPNLKSWSLAALETINTGMEHEMGSHRVPVPDLTTIVGKLFQFQIPSSAFSGEVLRYKAIRAGSRELPKWIHFDENAGLFSGVPLPEDKGQIYITVDGHIASTNGKVSVQTTMFSLNVIQPNFSTNSSLLKHIVIAEDQVSNCNQSSTTHLVQCLPSEARVLANVLFLVPFDSLTPSEKTQLFINTATLFHTCIQHLELRSINWTSDEGVWLWSKLATGKIIDTLESATILSFQIGCDNFNYFTQSPLLEVMAQSTDICREGLLLSDEGYVWVNCHQWFITARTKIFLSQTDALQAFSPSKEKARTKRQAFDGTDGPLDFPDYGIDNNDDEPSTSSAAMSLTPSLKTSISSTQTVASSVSESSSSTVSLMPSFLVHQPQNGTIVQSIQPTSLLAMPQPSASVPNSPTISFTLSEAKRSITPETSSTPIQFQATPTPTESVGSGSGSGSGVELSPDFSSSMEDVFFIGPTSIGQAESLLVPMPEPSTLILPGVLRSNIVSSSMSFSSIEVIEPQTQIPFLMVSSSPTSRPFIRVSSSPTQSPSTRTITSSSPVDRLSPRISSSAIDPPIDETTAVMMIITPTPSMSQLSFSIASTIEVLTSTVRVSPSVESSTEASPTQTFLFSMGSSDILRPLPLTTLPVIDFTVSSDIVATIVPTSTPIRTTNVLVPLPTSELSLSMSMFSPSSFPPDSSSIFMPIFTSSFVPSSALPVSPMPTTRSDVRLRPMSTSELMLSISMFTPTPIQSSTTIATTSQISSSFFSPMPTPSRTVTSEVSSILSVGETITSSFIFVMDSSESLIIPFSTSMVQLPSSSLALSSSFFSSSPFISPSPTPDISEIPIIPVPSPTPSMVPTICDVIDCNNGNCIPDESDTNFTCQCFPGYTGEFCDEMIESSSFIPMPTPSPPIGICDIIDCNNGTCLADDFSDNFTCQCDTGFTGEFCDIPLSVSSMITPTSSISLTSSFIFIIPSSESLLVPFLTSTSPFFTSSDFTFSISSSDFMLLPSSIPPIPSSAVSITSSLQATPVPSSLTTMAASSSLLITGAPSSLLTMAAPSSLSVMATPSTSSIIVSPTPSVNISMCDFFNCTNGVCIDLEGDFVICECFPGFTGLFCEVPMASSSFIVTISPTPSPPVDICDFIDCNNGTCVADEFGENFTCQCFAGYTGEFCDILLPTSTFITSTPSSSFILTASPTPSPPFNICDFIECNNGTCFTDEFGDNFTCQCFAGFTGEFCDILLPTSTFAFSIPSSSFILTASPSPSPPFDICDFIDCSNGTCVADEFGENFTCQCFVGYTGEFCDIPLILSSSIPPISVSSSMQFLIPSSESLLAPFSSPSPSIISTTSTPPIATPITQTPPITTPVAITPTPSPNISLCEFINCTNGECIDFGDDFVMCECFPGWTGMFCDMPIVSSSFVLSLSPTPSPSPIGVCDLIDCNNGTCVTDMFGENFTCQCFAGWTGEFCDIPLPPPSICDLVNCSGNGECVDLGDNFNCSCFPGFTGELCDTPLTLSPSLSSTMFISPTATPSPSPPISICDFINCSGNGNCTDLGDDFNCSCLPEYTGELCDIPLSPSPTQTSSVTEAFSTSSMFTFLVPSSESLLIPLPTPTTFIFFSSPLPTPSPSPPVNFCDFENCSGNGECNNLGDGFNCTCYIGWTGTLCETDIDFCQPDKFGSCNQTGTAMCVDGNSTHTCECLAGFTGDLCSVDIDDCDPDPCFNNATCINLLFDEFMCECLPRFTGELCAETFSPCDPNPCKEPDEVCIVTGFEEGDFMCIAPPTTTSMISPSITDSLTSIVTPSFSSTAVQLTSIASLSTSSVLTSTSAMPTPTPVPPNSAPIVLNPIGTLLANEGQVTHFTIPELTFYDLESGSTSNLRLSLLDSGASELPNTTWIHVNGGAIQALPLREQAIFGIVTEYTFILRASDERGASTHDFVTIRVLRQREDFQNFLVVLFEGSFTTFNQSLTEKISLAQRLSAHTNGTVSSVATVLSTPNMYISAFRNGSIAVVYRDISIPDTHCANFRAWVATVYADSSYSPSFIQILSPRFIPTAQPVIEGPCNLTDVNPTLAATQGLSPVPQSNIILFLAIVIPTIFVACICLLIGILLFINYRSRRSERKSLKSKAMERTFTRRRPVILDEEWDLPNRRRRPVILPSDYTIANMRALAIADPANDGNGGRRLLLEEVDYGREDGSSDEEEIVTSPGLSLTLRNRHALMSPDPPVDEGPPPYVLPPLFPT